MKSMSDMLEGRSFRLQPRFTTIYHPIRIELELTVNEYVVIDSVHQLSHKPSHPWCTQSKEDIAEYTGISRATVFRAIDNAIKKGLLEKNERGDVRSTELWIETVMLYKRKTSK